MNIDLNEKLSLAKLRSNLFPTNSDTEHVVFLFAKVKETTFLTLDFIVLQPSDFDYQSSYHINVKSDVISQLIKSAHDTNTSLIEIHSHIDQPKAKFSYSDWSGFEDFVPHILWRLPKRPYGALVFADNSFDGLYWKNSFNEYRSINKIIDGSDVINSTGLSQKPSRYYE